MSRIEQEDIVEIDGRTVKLKGVFTPKEFKSFCLERGWDFKPRGDYGRAVAGGLSKATHYINTKNTYFFL